MDDAVQRMLARAFRRAPARNANEEIARARAEVDGRSYEIILKQDATYGELRNRLAPRLARFLDNVRAPLTSRRVVLSVFCGDFLFFLHAAQLFEHLVEEEGIEAGQLREHLARWEAEGVEPVALLEGEPSPA